MDRSFRLAAALTIGITIPVAVLFYFQFRSISDLGRSTEVVLRQLSQDTTDDLVKRIADALKTPHVEVLLRISQGETEPLDVPFIEETFAAGLARSPFVSRFYAWSDVTGAHRGEVLAFDRENPHLHGEVAEAALLMHDLGELSQRKQPVNGLTTTIGGRRVYVQAQIRYRNPSRDRLTSFTAFAVDLDRLRTEFLPALLVSQMIGREVPSGLPPLVVTLLGEGNTVIFPPGGSASARYVNERELPLVFFDREAFEYISAVQPSPQTWHLRTGYGDQTIPDILEARAAPQRVMMAVLAGVMALAVFFVVRAAAREVRLAELRSNFVSSVSHDLKTPLSLIQLFAETLELGRLKNTDRAQEYYRIINSEARKLTRLINNLLDFSKIEAGLRQYNVEPVDLGELTGRVLASLGSQFRHHEFTVTSEVAPNVPPVLIDREAAEQAIENLLSNAMKYSPEHRHILVQVDQVGQFGRVRVTDRGIGIPRGLQRKIFRKFYRIQTDAGSGAQGTGLGLAIVDHIMRTLGGFVEIESEPGCGSTFALHFPIDKEAHDEAHPGDRRRAADVARSA